LAASFFAAASLAGFLPAIGISISFCPAAALRAFLAGFFGASVAAAAPPPMLFRSASTRSTTFWPRGTRFRGDGLTGALLVDEIYEGGFVLVFEFIRLEMSRLLVDDVLGKIKHVPGDFDVLNIVETLVCGTDFVGTAQQRPHQPLVERLQRDDVFAIS
jgi:hypothetical protein